jgi:hypothetical protein
MCIYAVHTYEIGMQNKPFQPDEVRGHEALWSHADGQCIRVGWIVDYGVIDYTRGPDSSANQARLDLGGWSLPGGRSMYERSPDLWETLLHR